MINIKEMLRELKREKDELEHRRAKIMVAMEKLESIEILQDSSLNKNVKKETFLVNKKKKTLGEKSKKWSPDVFSFIKKNLNLSNRELTAEVNKKFGMETTERSLGVQISHHGISRKNLEVKKTKVKKKSREDEDIDESYEELTEEDYEKISGKPKKKEFTLDFLDGVIPSPELRKKVKDYLLKSNEKRSWVLRDKIIDKFKIEISTDKLSKFIASKKAKITNIKTDREVGIMHYNLHGSYACNPPMNARKEKLTEDINKVTCARCRRYYNKQEEEENDFVAEDEE